MLFRARARHAQQLAESENPRRDEPGATRHDQGRADRVAAHTEASAILPPKSSEVCSACGETWGHDIHARARQAAAIMGGGPHDPYVRILKSEYDRLRALDVSEIWSLGLELPPAA